MNGLDDGRPELWRGDLHQVQRIVKKPGCHRHTDSAHDQIDEQEANKENSRKEIDGFWAAKIKEYEQEGEPKGNMEKLAVYFTQSTYPTSHQLYGMRLARGPARLQRLQMCGLPGKSG